MGTLGIRFQIVVEISGVFEFCLGIIYFLFKELQEVNYELWFEFLAWIYFTFKFFIFNDETIGSFGFWSLDNLMELVSIIQKSYSGFYLYRLSLLSRLSLIVILGLIFLELWLLVHVIIK